MGAARRHLDAVAGTARQLASWRGARAARVRRRGRRDREKRAGHDGRNGRAVQARARGVACGRARRRAWGGKAGGVYAHWELDDQVAAKVLEIESKPRYAAPFILEGGAIHVDGQGTLLTTE